MTGNMKESRRNGVCSDISSQFSEESHLAVASLTIKVVVKTHRSKDRKSFSLLDGQ